MNAGMLNHLFDICEPDEAQDADGYPEPAFKPKVRWSGVWGNLRAASMTDVSGTSERQRGNQVAATVDSIITIRYREGVKPTFYLIENKTKRRFNVVKAADETGMRTWLTIQCLEAA